jgi:mannose PTS system EIID component
VNELRTAFRLLLRSLLIQGSWNRKTMIGSGMQWALLPELEALGSGEARAERMARAGEHFNSHPYLAGLALGALLRLERDGEDPVVIRRFREALRGPLGSLGDRLVWAALRPAAILLAVSLWVAGLPPLTVVMIFLLGYNVPHLSLRAWGVRVGLARGLGVGQAIARADLGGIARRLIASAAVLMGLLAGTLLVPALLVGPAGGSGLLVLPAVLLFLWGFLRGGSVRPMIPWIAVVAVAGLLAFGSP